MPCIHNDIHNKQKLWSEVGEIMWMSRLRKCTVDIVFKLEKQKEREKTAIFCFILLKIFYANISY